jgi:DNA adenine methylase
MADSRSPRERPRPFLKWAGGKATLIEEIAKRVPPTETLTRYVEPFVGGGAFFFWIRHELSHLACRISDRNPLLTNTYVVVRDAVDELLPALQVHAHKHSSEHYYKVRQSNPTDPVEQAALFIYLNRTCYNGLWRVNRRGEFNVPLGKYASPKIVNESNLRLVSQALRDVEILCVDFEEAVSDCGQSDLIYFDPPYQPLSTTSRFTAYTSEGFGREEQERLARVFETLRKKGAFVILSNSDAEIVRRLYRALRPKPTLDRVRVPRSINSKAGSRGAIDELLIYHRSRERV